MRKVFIIVLLAVSASLGTLAQKHDHDHGHVHEIGISFAPVYFFGEEELSFATHLHYVYNFPHTKFGVGIGYERIFDEHKHNFVGVELNYLPIHKLTLNVSPGLVFEGEHSDEKDFALHFETVYEFEFGTFSSGPVLELAYHPEDVHASLGLHLGLAL